MAAQMFGNAGREHMEKYGTRPEHFAKIALKNHKHSVNNPFVPEDKGKGEGNNNTCVAVRLLHPSSHLVLVFALGQALAIPRRIHTRADYGLLQGARTADQAAVLPDVSSVVVDSNSSCICIAISQFIPSAPKHPARTVVRLLFCAARTLCASTSSRVGGWMGEDGCRPRLTIIIPDSATPFCRPLYRQGH